jgi:hypothetical protein
VTGVAAIHHSLRHVDPSAGDIRSVIDIDHAADRAAIDAHPQAQV